MASFVVAGSDGTVLALDAASGQRALARRCRQGDLAPVSAATVACRGGHARQRTGGVRSRQRALAQTVELAHHHRAAGGRRARVRDGCRPRRARLRRARRPAVVAPAAPRRCADAVAAGRCWPPTRTPWSSGRGRRLVGLDPLRGSVRWEVAIGQRRAAPTRSNAWPTWSARRCASATRSARVRSSRRWAARRADSGTLRWSRNVGGQHAVGGDTELVVGADASDRISAWKADSGDIAWTQDKFLYRGLSAPAGHAAGGAVRRLGGLAARAVARRWPAGGALRHRRLGSRRVSRCCGNDIVLVVTRNGGLYAFRFD